MWDSGFMADIDNLTGINENFDTIKTLLNSIRAQGILNTSDVDKLLSGINAKLEKINTEEDIDLIKVFLTELKQNLDERHNVLVSKFGAIEALFSNLLKNSNELPKSSELKELFDIVATNLSVFSREVVAQKESLTDITLRLDALRSDDSQKKDIIKNITLLKPDLERLSNGFDTIVLSLNDNFKTLAKTISTIDKTEYLNKFSDSLNSIEMSSNAVLSALQLLDKKTGAVDDAVKNLVTKADLSETDRNIADLKQLSGDLNDSINEINGHYSRIDNLADKIDASVNIIASLKSVLEDADNQNAKSILERIDALGEGLNEIKDDSSFEEFKTSLMSTLRDLTDSTAQNDKNLGLNSETLSEILNILKALDVNTNFSSVLSAIDNIATSADSITTKLNQTQSELTAICEGSFNTVFENIADLRKIVSQVDENGVSANNAMFSNITDRLNLFESALKESLEAQESTTNDASVKLCEQVENIKNLSNVLDYKMDSSVVEISNMTRMFETLKTSVDGVLALNFVETVKDLRADVYASKQDLTLAIETSGNNLSEGLSNDLYGKYELLISKLDSIEDEFRKIQAESLAYVKEVMEKISDSLVDIISYVSEAKEFPIEEIDRKIEGLSGVLNETNLNYVESVRDAVDVVRVQVENNLKSIEEESVKRLDLISKNLDLSKDELKADVKNSYDKLLEIKNAYEELKEIVNVNSIDNSNSFDKLITNVSNVSSEFDGKILLLKSALLDKISEFKNDFTCDNADKIKEFKFTVESLYNKNSQDIVDLLENIKVQLNNFAAESGETRTSVLDNITVQLDDLKALLADFSSISNNTRTQALEKIYGNFETLKASVKTLSDETYTGRKAGIEKLMDNMSSLKEEMSSLAKTNDETREQALIKINDQYEDLKTKIEQLGEENSGARTNTLSKLLENFVGLKDYVQALNAKTSEELTKKNNAVIECLDSVKAVLNKVDENVDGDMTRQLSIIESNFESLVSQMTILNEKAEQSLIEKINDEYNNINERINNNVSRKLEEYKSKIEETFDDLSERAQSQSSYLQERISDINSVMKNVWMEQSERNMIEIDKISDKLKDILDDNLEKTSLDYSDLKARLDEFTRDLSSNNEVLTQNLKAQLDDMTTYVDSVLDIQTQEADAHIDEFAQLIESLNEKFNSKTVELKTTINGQTEVSNNIKADVQSLIEESEQANEKLSSISASLDEKSGIARKKLDDIREAIDEKSAEFRSLLENLNDSLEAKTEENKTELASINESVQSNNDKITTVAAEISTELRAIEASANTILEQLEIEKQTIVAIKEFMSGILQNKLKEVSSEIERETDIIITELVEQFDNVKKSQQDAAIQITTGIESIVENQIYNNIEDLKSYLDVKTDSSVITDKLDNLKLEMVASFENVVTDMNKMLQADVFTSAISDYRVANEILINSAVDRINEKVADFLGTSSKQLSEQIGGESKNIENKLALFDKKFIETVVDKYEEIKLIANKYNNSFDSINKSINGVITDFQGVKSDIDTKIEHLENSVKASIETTNVEVRKLNNCFEQLRSQISNKSFDEAFQASINKQIYSLESLIKEQYDCIDDINEMCGVNLPDVSELNTLVKGAVLEELYGLSQKVSELNLKNTDNLILETANNISEQIEAQNIEETIEEALKDTKADIITQFLNIFNQISFVAEQEEIIDYIQERHDELITVLSHIVTTASDISAVHDDVAVVNDKIDSLKDEIGLINEKITSIMSSDGYVDYVYSLQDLESDIANLRVVLKDMQEHSEGYGSEITNLITSTDKVYKLVESIKDEIPDKKSFDNLTEDIVSISTRTNKLILASDESYKTLQDNLHDFKLVINDLDERTRNFAQESGMDKIDSKLNALNTMVQNGAKTNQVFNQVFEYLAEWVDNAGNQISAISDKVETLDDIGQIKLMLADLKAEAEDNSDNVELIETLGNVFDKQAKKISALETKLDKMIVDNTVSKKASKLDTKPIEDTLNKFLASIGKTISSQQEKIDSLEEKLEKVVDILGDKNSAQLTKKVGGMDRQIAKLNKSIEKIASYVVEK